MKISLKTKSYNKNETVECEFLNIEQEYLISDEIMNNNHILIRLLNDLPIQDRRLLIFYSELQSYEKVANYFNCSKPLIQQKINKIRDKFLEKLEMDKSIIKEIRELNKQAKNEEFMNVNLIKNKLINK